MDGNVSGVEVVAMEDTRAEVIGGGRRVWSGSGSDLGGGGEFVRE